MSDLILIQYSNSVDFAEIVYHNTFENKLYLNADVSKPEYELVEEGIENGDGEFSPTFQKWAKKYKIEFYAQEYLVDAVTLMALHDQIYVTLKNEESSKVTDIEVDYEWDGTIECWAKVTITFATEYYTQTNCTENMDSGCLTAAYTLDTIFGFTDAQYTDPTSVGVVAGTYAFIYDTTSIDTEGTYQYESGSNGTAGVYYFNNSGVWVMQDLADNALIYMDVATPYYLINSTNFAKIPFIREVTGGVGELTILATADGIENQFYEVFTDGGAGYTSRGSFYASDFTGGGKTITLAAGTYDVKVLWFIHGCDYGYSNEATGIVVT